MPRLVGRQVQPAGSVAPGRRADRQDHTVWSTADSLGARGPVSATDRANLTTPGRGLSVTWVPNSPKRPCRLLVLPAAICFPFSSIWYLPPVRGSPPTPVWPGTLSLYGLRSSVSVSPAGRRTAPTAIGSTCPRDRS